MSRNSSLAVLAECTDANLSHISLAGVYNPSSVLSIDNETILTNNTDMSPSDVIGNKSFLERVQSMDIAKLFPRGSLNETKIKKRNCESLNIFTSSDTTSSVISDESNQKIENDISSFSLSNITNEIHGNNTTENKLADSSASSKKLRGVKKPIRRKKKNALNISFELTPDKRHSAEEKVINESKSTKAFNKKLYLKKKSINVSFDSCSSDKLSDIENIVKSIRRNRSRVVNVSLESMSTTRRNTTKEGKFDMENYDSGSITACSDLSDLPANKFLNRKSSTKNHTIDISMSSEKEKQPENPDHSVIKNRINGKVQRKVSVQIEDDSFDRSRSNKSQNDESSNDEKNENTNGTGETKTSMDVEHDICKENSIGERNVNLTSVSNISEDSETKFENIPDKINESDETKNKLVQNTFNNGSDELGAEDNDLQKKIKNILDAQETSVPIDVGLSVHDNACEQQNSNLILQETEKSREYSDTISEAIAFHQTSSHLAAHSAINKISSCASLDKKNNCEHKETESAEEKIINESKSPKAFNKNLYLKKKSINVSFDSCSSDIENIVKSIKGNGNGVVNVSLESMSTTQSTIKEGKCDMENDDLGSVTACSDLSLPANKFLNRKSSTKNHTIDILTSPEKEKQPENPESSVIKNKINGKVQRKVSVQIEDDSFDRSSNKSQNDESFKDEKNENTNGTGETKTSMDVEHDICKENSIGERNVNLTSVSNISEDLETKFENIPDKINESDETKNKLVQNTFNNGSDELGAEDGDLQKKIKNILDAQETSVPIDVGLSVHDNACEQQNSNLILEETEKSREYSDTISEAIAFHQTSSHLAGHSAINKKSSCASLDEKNNCEHKETESAEEKIINESKSPKAFNKNLYLKKKSINVSFDSCSSDIENIVKSIKGNRNVFVNVSLESMSTTRSNTKEGKCDMENDDSGSVTACSDLSLPANKFLNRKSSTKNHTIDISMSSEKEKQPENPDHSVIKNRINGKVQRKVSVQIEDDSFDRSRNNKSQNDESSNDEKNENTNGTGETKTSMDVEHDICKENSIGERNVNLTSVSNISEDSETKFENIPDNESDETKNKLVQNTFNNGSDKLGAENGDLQKKIKNILDAQETSVSIDVGLSVHDNACEQQNSNLILEETEKSREYSDTISEAIAFHQTSSHLAAHSAINKISSCASLDEKNNCEHKETGSAEEKVINKFKYPIAFNKNLYLKKKSINVSFDSCSSDVENIVKSIKGNGNRIVNVSLESMSTTRSTTKEGKCDMENDDLGSVTACSDLSLPLNKFLNRKTSTKSHTIDISKSSEKEKQPENPESSVIKNKINGKVQRKVSVQIEDDSFDRSSNKSQNDESFKDEKNEDTNGTGETKTSMDVEHDICKENIIGERNVNLTSVSNSSMDLETKFENIPDKINESDDTKNKFVQNTGSFSRKIQFTGRIDDFIDDISIIPNKKKKTKNKMYHSTPITRSYSKNNKNETNVSINNTKVMEDEYIQHDDKMIQVSKTIFGSSTEGTSVSASNKKSLELSTSNISKIEENRNSCKRKSDSVNSITKRLKETESSLESRSYHSNFISTLESYSSYQTTRKSEKRVAFKGISSSENTTASSSTSDSSYYVTRNGKSVNFRELISLIDDFSDGDDIRDIDNDRKRSSVNPQSINNNMDHDLPDLDDDSKSRIERTNMSLNYAADIPEIILTENEIEESSEECSLYTKLKKMAQFKKPRKKSPLRKGIGKKQVRAELENVGKSKNSYCEAPEPVSHEKWVSPNLIKFLNEKLFNDDLDHVIKTERVISILCSVVNAVKILQYVDDIEMALQPLKNILVKYEICCDMITYSTFISRFTPFEFQNKALSLGGYFGSIKRVNKNKLTDPILIDTEK